eukprot:CAMPEP_0182839416 /NCGR_PEP_ID=MMETSP0006_2-20121128/23853_1 /TAXON_ID=97485 /ORGANISM="Prymnesium parvum, Strain Texoma1" /LENGTH=46 /DNA_ID= /DNA_START= /DNA_END= /DNA_ORIENTATION=
MSHFQSTDRSLASIFTLEQASDNCMAAHLTGATGGANRHDDRATEH